MILLVIEKIEREQEYEQEQEEEAKALHKRNAACKLTGFGNQRSPGILA